MLFFVCHVPASHDVNTATHAPNFSPTVPTPEGVHVNYLSWTNVFLIMSDRL